MEDIKYNEWIELEKNGIYSYGYQFENDDIILYDVDNETKCINSFCIYVQNSNTKSKEDIIPTDILYETDVELLRNLLMLKYKEIKDMMEG